MPATRPPPAGHGQPPTPAGLPTQVAVMDRSYKDTPKPTSLLNLCPAPGRQSPYPPPS